MEDEGSNRESEVTSPPPPAAPDALVNGDVTIQNDEDKESDVNKNSECSEHKNVEAETQIEMKDVSNDESGVVVDGVEASPPALEREASVEGCEGNEDVRSLGDLDSLPAGDELALGAAGSDSGVEGCGRALSSGGGSRSCASSVVSCGSGCGSESSSLAGAPPRPRRRVNVAGPEPKRSSPVGTSTPRPVTAPRGPNLATRERARSREKPTPPEKPRPLTPKPRIRPAGELPSLVRESPALRAKPTKTSAARCRTPSSPGEEKRWPAGGAPRLPPTAADATAARLAADKYGTLPRRRRDVDASGDGSPKHEATPPARRPLVARSASSRSAVRTRVRIFAEKTSQTVLLGTDVEAALGGNLPDVETRTAVTTCSRGVQASGRAAEAARLAALQAELAEERSARAAAERALAGERAARAAALAELARNSRRLVELAGAAGGPASADACLRALDDQLRAAAERAAQHRTELDALRDALAAARAQSGADRERARAAEARLQEAEREAQEMQDFLAAETAALSHSLRDAEQELARLNAELEKSRGECRQLVRLCEQRRQETLAAAARARGGAGRALDSLARRLARLTAAVTRAYRLPAEPEPTVFHNDAFSRSDSGEALTPDEEPRGGGGLVTAVSRALRTAVPAPAPPADDDDVSRISDEYDNSADLLDSETEPCFVTDPCFVNDPEYAEEWWSGAEGAAAWSGDDLSPERDYPDDIIDKDCESGSTSERESLRTLSAAIAVRQRSEARDGRGALAARVAALDARLAALLHALRRAAQPPHDLAAQRLAHALRDKIEVTEKNVADVVVKKLAELDASKNMMEQYRHSVETLKTQLAHADDEDNLDILEEEVSSLCEAERRARYAALDGALAALGGAAARWPRLAALAARLERLAFALAAPPPPPPHLHTTACALLDATHAPAPLHTTA